LAGGVPRTIVGHGRAQEACVANRGKGGDFDHRKAAARNHKQDRQEQRRQDRKARKAGKAERAAEE